MEMLDFRRIWYLVDSLLSGPKCCIWNRPSWNSNVVCRSYRTKFGRFL